MSGLLLFLSRATTLPTPYALLLTTPSSLAAGIRAGIRAFSGADRGSEEELAMLDTSLRCLCQLKWSVRCKCFKLC